MWDQQQAAASGDLDAGLVDPDGMIITPADDRN